MKIPYTIILLFLLLVYSVGSTYFAIKMMDRFDRVESNQSTLLNQMNNIDKNKQLVLTPAEFKHSMDSTTVSLLKTLKLHAKNVENIIGVKAEGKIRVVTVPRDTIIVRHDTLIPATTFTYSDKYMSIKGIQTKKQTEVIAEGTDSLNILLYWKREGKFIPIIFGKKTYRATIKGSNPYMKYIITKNIKIMKQ
jgi:hypothetical protein